MSLSSLVDAMEQAHYYEEQGSLNKARSFLTHVLTTANKIEREQGAKLSEKQLCLLNDIRDEAQRRKTALDEGVDVNEDFDVLFACTSGVRIFSVLNGDLSAFEGHDEYCEMALVKDKIADAGVIQCGDLIIPLEPTSMCLRRGGNLFMFPCDDNPETGQESIGLLLDAAMINPDEIEAFSTMLADICEVNEIPGSTPEQPAPSSVTTREDSDSPGTVSRVMNQDDEDGMLVRTIQKGSEITATGIRWLASATSSLISSGGEYLRSRISPLEEPVEVSERTVQLSQNAKSTMKVASQLSKAGVQGIYHLASAAYKRAEPAVLKAFGIDKRSPATSPSPNATKVKKVIRTSVVGALHLLEALEFASTKIIGTLADESAETVHHRYGDQAGLVARNSASATKNAVDVYFCARQLRKRATDFPHERHF